MKDLLTIALVALGYTNLLLAIGSTIATCLGVKIDEPKTIKITKPIRCKKVLNLTWLRYNMYSIHCINTDNKHSVFLKTDNSQWRETILDSP
jgi:hypothetical protein